MKSRADVWLLLTAAMMLPAPVSSFAADSARGRPIRLIVAFAPGGGSDTLARFISPKLTELVGRPVVVDNRPGGAGNLATELAVRATPDGNTLLWGFSAPLVINPTLYKKLPFDIERDLAPISLLAKEQFMLVVNPGVPVNSVSELVALAKAKPGQLTFASAGVGTPLHLAAQLFRKRTETDIVHVPFKGGGPAAVAVVSGEVKMLFGSFASTLPHVRTKMLKALALTGPQRSNEVPDLPTMQELGFAGFDIRAWFGVLAPAATPRPTIMQLNRDFLRVLAMPEVQEDLRKHGLEVTGSSPEEFARHMRNEKALWASVIKDAGITPE